MQLYALLTALFVDGIILLFLSAIALTAWGLILTYYPETPERIARYTRRTHAWIRSRPTYHRLTSRLQHSA